MYNRYIPQSDGSYQRNRVGEHRQQNIRPKPHPNHAPQQPEQADTVPPSKTDTSAGNFLKQLLPKNFDTGDLLVVLLLLLIAGDCEEEKTTAFLTLALYFFM